MAPSFIPDESQGEGPPSFSFSRRLVGVFLRPAETFANLHLHPHWLAAFLVLTAVVAIYDFLAIQRLNPDVTLNAFIQGLSWLGVSSNFIEELRSSTPQLLLIGPILHIGLIWLLLLLLTVALMLLGRWFGGRITYQQALSVATYSTLPPAVIERVISIILLYTNPVGRFSPLQAINGIAPLDLRFLFSATERPLLHAAAGCISLIWLYRARLQATGLRYTGERITSVKSWTIAALIWITGALATVFARSIID